MHGITTVLLRHAYSQGSWGHTDS